MNKFTSYNIERIKLAIEVSHKTLQQAANLLGFNYKDLKHLDFHKAELSLLKIKTELPKLHPDITGNDDAKTELYMAISNIKLELTKIYDKYKAYQDIKEKVTSDRIKSEETEETEEQKKIRQQKAREKLVEILQQAANLLGFDYKDLKSMNVNQAEQILLKIEEELPRLRKYVNVNDYKTQLYLAIRSIKIDLTKICDKFYHDI